MGRAARERLFNSLAEEGEITVGENGRCERDAIKCVALLYSRFSAAMRNDFSSARPARPILIFDGTGGSLGKGICHAEMGSADFIGECKQSRSTLEPLAMYTGNDHALPLRANLEFSMASFNRLSDAGQLELDNGVRIPCEPIVVGDMQGIKCIMGMSEVCHSVWCKCKARGNEGEGPQHDYGEAGTEFESYSEMMQHFEAVGCEFKEEDFLLACAHLSKGLFYGGKFTSFTCPDCGYRPTAAQARADLAKFKALTDEEQKELRKRHVAGGAHWHVELFMGPMPKGFGMRRCGADQLHLVYLNMFKHLFKYTIHEPLPESKKKLVSQYIAAAGFYSYDAADESDDPVKRWIGREVKRFLHEADQHIPFLLTFHRVRSTSATTAYSIPTMRTRRWTCRATSSNRLRMRWRRKLLAPPLSLSTPSDGTAFSNGCGASRSRGRKTQMSTGRCARCSIVMARARARATSWTSSPRWRHGSPTLLATSCHGKLSSSVTRAAGRLMRASLTGRALNGRSNI